MEWIVASKTPRQDVGNTSIYRRHHAGRDGVPEGVNALFFDGSVKWIPAGPRNANNMPTNLAGTSAQFLANYRPGYGSLFHLRQNALPQ